MADEIRVNSVRVRNPKRIAIVYSRYQSNLPSGESEVVSLQYEALLEAGNEVKLLEKETPSKRISLTYRIRTFFRVALGYGNSPISDLRTYSPEFILIHNLHPNFGTKWIRKFKNENPDVKIINFIHNHRAMCAAGTLVRQGKMCTDCLGKSQWRSVVHKCYRNSVLGSLAMYIASLRKSFQKDLLDFSDLTVFISEKSLSVYNKEGYKFTQKTVLGNFQPKGSDEKSIIESRNKYIYAGRLSPEKGILELVDAWPEEFELEIFGSGILESEVRKLTSERGNIQYNGLVSSRSLNSILGNYRALLLPSICPELSPLTVQAALSNGTPIICLSLNQFWSNDESAPGVALENLDIESVRSAVREIERNEGSFSENSYLHYLNNHTKNSWLKQIDKALEDLR